MAFFALAKKMQLDTAKRAAIINPPEGYLDHLRPLPKDLEILHEFNGKFDWMQIFVKNKAEFDKLLPKDLKGHGARIASLGQFPQRQLENANRPDPRQGLGQPEGRGSQMGKPNLG